MNNQNFIVHSLLFEDVMQPWMKQHPFSRLGIESPQEGTTIYKKGLLRRKEIITIEPPYEEANVKILDKGYTDLAARIIEKLKAYHDRRRNL